MNPNMIGIGFVLGYLFFLIGMYAVCKVSGDCSRREEKEFYEKELKTDGSETIFDAAEENRCNDHK